MAGETPCVEDALQMKATPTVLGKQEVEATAHDQGQDFVLACVPAALHQVLGDVFGRPGQNSQRLIEAYH